MFLDLCVYLCLIGSKRLAFHERSFMVLGSIYMCLFQDTCFMKEVVWFLVLCMYLCSIAIID